MSVIGDRYCFFSSSIPPSVLLDSDTEIGNAVNSIKLLWSSSGNPRIRREFYNSINNFTRNSHGVNEEQHNINVTT